MSNNLEQKDNNEPNNRIIVYNLNFDTDEIGLRDYFSKYGEVLNVEIPISQNRSRGFGFVTFSSIEEATKANDPTIVHELNDRKVRTSFANKREKERDDEFRVKKLYIGKLPHEINETELKEYFEQFGTVSDAFISSVKFAPLLNGFPQHKGYGFVTFENDEDANKAVKQKSHVLKGANIFVRKAIPQRDEERSSKGERRNKNNNNSRSKSNKGGRSERSNKDTGSSTKSESSSSNQDNSSTTTTQTGTYSPSTNNNNNTPTEKKTVVVKRKDNDNKSTETSSTTTNNTTPTTNNTPSENKTETTSSNKSTSSNKTSSSNKSSSNNNDNKKKSITVNQKNTKPVITIQKSSTVNPWKTQQNTTPSQPLNNEFPSLGKKENPTKYNPFPTFEQ